GITLLTRPDSSSNLPAGKRTNAKPDGSDSPPMLPIPLSLNRVTVRDGHIELDNRKTKSRIIIDMFSSTLDLHIDKGLTDIASTGKTTIEDISFASDKTNKVLHGIRAEFIHEITGNPSTGDFTLSPGELYINELPISVTGTVAGWTKTTFNIEAGNLDMESVLNAVPSDVIPEKDTLNAVGTFTLSVSGLLDTVPEEPVLSYRGSVDIPHATLACRGMPKKVDDITSYITFTEKEIDINTVSVRIGSSQVSISGTVNNYIDEPVVALLSEGDVDITDVTDAFPLPKGMDAEGNVDFDIRLDGTPSDPKSFAARGRINLKNVTATVPETLNNPATLNGTIALSPSHVEIERLGVVSGNTDAELTGRLGGYMTLAGPGGDTAVFNGMIKSNVIDINDLLVTGKENKKSVKPWDFEKTLKTLPVPPQLSANLDIGLGSVIFGRLKTDSVRCRLSLDGGILGLSDLNAAAYTGILIGKSTINFADPENTSYSGYFSLKALESSRFIADFFGIGEHFKGKLSGSLSFSGSGLDSVSVVQNLKVSGGMLFEDGRIDNWEFTRKLGNYLKFLDFDTLEYDTIINTFRVENQKVFIPDMAVKSTYGDIRLDGVIGFDTSLDNNITLILNKEYSAKALKRLDNLSKLLKNQPERLDLLVTVGGTINSPSFSLDTSRAEEQLKETVKEEVTRFLDKQKDDIKEAGKKLLDKLFK
ncbi:AsmA-like C-terminal region-containing protein, partial [Candidatus Latescibacterota bacterium]